LVLLIPSLLKMLAEFFQTPPNMLDAKYHKQGTIQILLAQLLLEHGNLFSQ